MTVSAALEMTDRIKDALQPPGKSNVDSIIGEYTGFNRKMIQELRQVRRSLGQHGDEIDAVIHQNIRLIDAGLLKPSSAYDRVAKAIAYKEAPAPSAAVQRKIMNNSAQVGAGLIDGLRGLGPVLDDALSAGECAVWARQLAATRLELERVIRLLKGRAINA
jgi:hypothetical protein